MVILHKISAFWDYLFMSISRLFRLRMGVDWHDIKAVWIHILLMFIVDIILHAFCSLMNIYEHSFLYYFTIKTGDLPRTTWSNLYISFSYIILVRLRTTAEFVVAILLLSSDLFSSARYDIAILNKLLWFISGSSPVSNIGGSPWSLKKVLLSSKAYEWERRGWGHVLVKFYYRLVLLAAMEDRLFIVGTLIALSMIEMVWLSAGTSIASKYESIMFLMCVFLVSSLKYMSARSICPELTALLTTNFV